MCFTAPRGGHNPEYEIDIRARHAARDHSVERRQVLGVDDVPNHLHRDLGRGIELEDAEGLLGPVVVVRQQIRDEAARLAQPLGFGETKVGLLDLSPPPVFDPRCRTRPHTTDRFCPCLIEQRIVADQEPAISAVLAQRDVAHTRTEAGV